MKKGRKTMEGCSKEQRACNIDMGTSLDYFKACLGKLVTILEKAMAPHSSTLVWKIPWTKEPGRLQSMGLLRVRHD